METLFHPHHHQKAGSPSTCEKLTLTAPRLFVNTSRGASASLPRGRTHRAPRPGEAALRIMACKHSHTKTPAPMVNRGSSAYLWQHAGAASTGHAEREAMQTPHAAEQQCQHARKGPVRRAVSATARWRAPGTGATSWQRLTGRRTPDQPGITLPLALPLAEEPLPAP